MRHLGDLQSAHWAEARRNRIEAVGTIEVDILAGIDEVESTDPGGDGEAKEQRWHEVRQANRRIDRQPATNWRYAVRQASPTMVRLLLRRGWQVVGPASDDPRFPGISFQVTWFDYTAEPSPASGSDRS